MIAMNRMATGGIVLLVLVGAYVGVEGVNTWKEGKKLAALTTKLEANAKPVAAKTSPASVSGDESVKSVVTEFLDRLNLVRPGAKLDIPSDLMSASFYADFQTKDMPGMQKNLKAATDGGIESQDVSVTITNVSWIGQERRSAKVTAQQVVQFRKDGKPVYEITYDNQFEVTQGKTGSYVITMWSYQRGSIKKLEG